MHIVPPEPRSTRRQLFTSASTRAPLAMAARAPRRRRVPLAASPRPSADVDATSLALCVSARIARWRSYECSQLEHRLLLTLGALDIANDGRAQAEGVAEDLRAQNALLVDRLRVRLPAMEPAEASGGPR